jgi:hypothetical protein
MYQVMRIMDSDGEVYYLAGHDEQDAKNSFGDDVSIDMLFAVKEKDIIQEE